MTHHISWKNIPLRVPQTYIYWIGPSRSELGKLRRRCDECIATTDKWKRKTQLLQKICRNLNMVMRKYISDVIGGKELPVPVKIVRSVGLQVTKVNVARIVAYFKILFLSCFQQKLPKLTRLHVNQLWRADKNGKILFFFAHFQMFFLDFRCEITEKGVKWPKKAQKLFQPALGCAQHPKAGQHTQYVIIWKQTLSHPAYICWKYWVFSRVDESARLGRNIKDKANLVFTYFDEYKYGS